MAITATGNGTSAVVSGSCGPSTSLSGSLASAPTVGDWLILVGGNYSSSASSYLGSVSGFGVTTWHNAAAVEQSSDGNGWFEVWYGQVTSTATSGSVLMQSGSGTVSPEFYAILEFSGVGSFDQATTTTNAAASTTASTPTITPAQSGELIIAGGCCGGQFTAAATSPFTGFDSYYNSTSVLTYGTAAYYVDTGSSAISTSWSQTTSDQYSTLIAAFKPSAASVVPLRPQVVSQAVNRSLTY